MDIESAPRRRTLEPFVRPIGRAARNPPKKSRDRAAVARDPPDGESATRPRDRTHTRANTHPNAAIKGKIDEVLVKLPEPARKKLEEIEVRLRSIEGMHRRRWLWDTLACCSKQM